MGLGRRDRQVETGDERAQFLPGDQMAGAQFAQMPLSSRVSPLGNSSR
jgi:hypothetical protein